MFVLILLLYSLSLWSEVNNVYLFQLLLSLVFETGSLINLELSDSAILDGQQAPGSFCFCPSPPSPWIADGNCHALVLHGFWGSKSGSSAGLKPQSQGRHKIPLLGHSKGRQLYSEAAGKAGVWTQVYLLRTFLI